MEGANGEGIMDYKQAEQFILDNRDLFLTSVYLMPGSPAEIVMSSEIDGKVKEVRPAYIEGADYVSLPVLGNNGNLEVKANGQFLTQDNNDMGKTYLEESGTLYFEMFLNWIPNRREDMCQGWIHALINPAEYTEIRRERRLAGIEKNKVTAQPWGALAIVLLTEAQRPFACVAFENIGKLIERLRSLCPDPVRWGLYNIRDLEPAQNKEYWDQYTKYWDGTQHKYHNIAWNRRHGGIIESDWHIPLSELQDLATVTMIGADPDPAEEYRLAREYAQSNKDRNGNPKPSTGYYGSVELITKRLEALKSISAQRGDMARVYPDQVRKARQDMERKTGKAGHFLTEAQMKQIELKYGANTPERKAALAEIQRIQALAEGAKNGKKK